MTRIGIDTNILVRLFVGDDEGQHAIVRQFLGTLADDDVIVINVVLLVEMVWTLRSRYGYRNVEMMHLLQGLLERRDVEIDDFESVGNAIECVRTSGADMADALIAELNRVSGCARTLTLDEKAARSVPGMELLT
ncbi:PIN domain-containing protein [Ensifer soli]|uniref:PIN domain-containing protein n=1 Tax=Ciceribacter sp. sgz301302 TaxID=3342379 RepID=UPI0035BB95EC